MYIYKVNGALKNPDRPKYLHLLQYSSSVVNITKMQQQSGTIIGVLLPSGLRFKNISFETRCATCSPLLPWSSFDKPTNPVSLTALWISQFLPYEKLLLCHGRLLLCLFGCWCACSWLRAGAWSWSDDVWKNTKAQVTSHTQEIQGEMNQPCLLFDVFAPSGKDFLPHLLSFLPFKHFLFPSFQSRFDITCSSRPLHLCSLSLCYYQSIHCSVKV